MPNGKLAGTVAPTMVGGPLDQPCPGCGTVDPQPLHRAWVLGATITDPSARSWRYVGVIQPDIEYRVPLPAGSWPDPVILPDVTYPDPYRRAEDPHAGALPQVGGQLAFVVAA